MYNFLCTLLLFQHVFLTIAIITISAFSSGRIVFQEAFCKTNPLISPSCLFFFLFFLIQAQRTSFDTLLLPCIVKQLQKFNTTQTVHLIYENYGILYYLWTKSIMHIIIIHELQNGTKWLPSSQLLSCFTALWILDFILALLDILFL